MQAQRGRPRDEAIEVKIRQAVVCLLIERGYGGTTIEQVAKLTGMGRPTIYRRYESRSAMINDVVKDILDESLASLVEHVDPYQNVRNHLINTVEMLCQSAIGPIYRAVISEIPSDIELAKIVGRVAGARRRRLTKAVDQAVEKKVLKFNGSTEIWIDGLVGAIYFRYLISPDSLSAKYVDKLLEPHI